MVRRRGNISGLFLAMCVSAPPMLFAQVAMPQKDEWQMHNGAVVRGKAYAFGYQLCFLQRRGGKILLNGQKISDPASNALLKKLCDEQGVPLDDSKQLQAVLSKQRFAQIVLPYYTLKYHDHAGKDQQIPTILLAPDEIQELRPVFEAWLAEKQRENEERMRRAQELQNQQAMLAMQAEALQAQQAMAYAAQANAAASARNADANERNAAANEKSAAANKKQADELERIRRQSR